MEYQRHWQQGEVFEFPVHEKSNWIFFDAEWQGLDEGNVVLDDFDIMELVAEADEVVDTFLA